MFLWSFSRSLMPIRNWIPCLLLWTGPGMFKRAKYYSLIGSKNFMVAAVYHAISCVCINWSYVPWYRNILTYVASIVQFALHRHPSTTCMTSQNGIVAEIEDSNQWKYKHVSLRCIITKWCTPACCHHWYGSTKLAVHVQKRQRGRHKFRIARGWTRSTLG